MENETGKVQVRCIVCKEEFEVDADRLRKLIREGLSFLESDERGTLGKHFHSFFFRSLHLAKTTIRS